MPTLRPGSAKTDRASEAVLTVQLRRAAMVGVYPLWLVAFVLAWPAGWGGLAPWWHLPLAPGSGAVLLLGAIASALLVTVLVREPWPRVCVVVGVAGVSLLNAPNQPQETRLILLSMLIVGLVAGLGVGAPASGGVLGASVALAVVVGVSPSSWPHAPVLALAVALPFWVARRDRVASTVLAVIRVVLVFLVARVLAMAFTEGWRLGTPTGLAPVGRVARRVGSATWDTLTHKTFDIAQTALTTHVSWLWGGVLLAVLVVLTRRVITSERVASAWADARRSRPKATEDPRLVRLRADPPRRPGANGRRRSR